METNGEAIYGTRGWEHFDEGEAIRYTRGVTHTYAGSLGLPGPPLNLRRIRPEAGTDIYLLGYDEPLNWSFDDGNGLTITIPESLQDESSRTGRYAYSFKIRGEPVRGDGGS